MLIERARRLTLDGDAASAASLLQIARQHDPDRAATLLDASADVRIECVPSGASLALLAQERQGPIVVERPLARGIAPLARALPPGSYVAEASRDGHATVRLPFVVAPGRALSFSIALPPASAVPEGFCVVPGGAWIVGGDRSAPGAEPRREVVLPPFAISARVVTMGEYAEFLSALDPEEARRRVPRVGGVPLAQAGEDGRYAPPWIDPDGDLVRADDPACGVSALDADAYAAWRARRTGLPLRLPTSDEWEVAARGADERAYPWGHGWDPTLSWNIVSRGRLRGLHTVGSRPLDRSPFGVLDAGGLVRNWTSTRTPSGGRLVRGGAFQAAADQCRIGRVTDAPEDSAYITFGLRLCLSWSA